METKLGKIKKMVLGPTAREKRGRVGWGKRSSLIPKPLFLTTVLCNSPSPFLMPWCW